MRIKQPFESLVIRANADDDPSNLRCIAATLASWPSQVDFADGGESDHLRAMGGILNAVAISAPIWAVAALASIWWLG